MICYWERCTCPASTPWGAICSEHGGRQCGYSGGRVITDSSVIVDQVVSDARRMIQVFESNVTEVEAMLAYIATVKAAQEDLEASIRTSDPGIFGEWREYKRIMAEVRRLEAYKPVLDTQLSELQGIQSLSHASPGINLIQSRLIIPFNGAGLRCECYNEKKDKLSMLFAEISASEQHAIDLFDEANRMREIAHNGLRAIGIVIMLTLLGFVLKFLTWKFARLLIPALTFVISLGTVLAAFQRGAEATKELLAERVKWTKLMIDYYQKQQITTCLPPIEDDDDTGQPPSEEDENHVHEEDTSNE